MSNNTESPGRLLNHHHSCHHHQANDQQQKNHFGQHKHGTTNSPYDKENAASEFIHHSMNHPMVDSSPGRDYDVIKSSTMTGTQSISTPVKAGDTFGVLDTPPKTPSSSFAPPKTALHQTPTNKTPIHKTPTHKTPTGSSRVLRKHFQRMALASNNSSHQHHHPIQYTFHHTPNSKITTNTEATSTNKRLLASGPIRRVPHRQHRDATIIAAKRRVGFDGTLRTPSKVLLRSTASSRGQRLHASEHDDSVNDININDITDNQSTDGILYRNTATNAATATSPNASSTGQIILPRPFLVETTDIASTTVKDSGIIDDDNITLASMDDITIDYSYDLSLLQQGQLHVHDEQEQPDNNHKHSALQNVPAIRKGCADPVAMILLNDGKENLHYLLQESSDIEIDNKSGADNDVDSSFSSCSHHYFPSPAKVSSQLLSTNLARPIARVASIKARQAIDAETEVRKKTTVMKINNNYNN